MLGSLPTQSRALSARNVSHRYGDVVALSDVSVSVAAGAVLALVGESGSGKTTLLRCFNRMIEPTSGEVRVGAADIAAQQLESLRRSIGYVPQDGGLLPHWRVLRNVALVPTLLQRADADAAARAALELVGLPAEKFGTRFPHELSGGQRQRVSLARALAAKPSVLLMDEPFGAVDAITRADLQSAFEAVRRELHITTLLVTHDLAESARLADEVAVMRNGRIEQIGPTHALQDTPATEYVAELFLRASAASDALRVSR